MRSPFDRRFAVNDGSGPLPGFRTPFTAILLILFLVTGIGCKHNPKENGLFALLIPMFVTPPDHYSRIYFVNPLYIAQKPGEEHLFVSRAKTADLQANKKKLILVHGWDYNDRNNAPLFGDFELQKRVVSYWRQVLRTPEIVSLVSSNYQLFLYDYLSSDGIDANGKRFRSQMDALFKSESGTVTIFAHSMGGLVSRFAVYEGTQPSYLARVISAATPYHGSPWASPQFQQSRSVLGKLAAFMTGTDGGQDLRWDNFDGSLTGATNPKLIAINRKTSRDSLFIVYYGSCDFPTNTLDCKNKLNDSEATGSLVSLCPLLYDPVLFTTFPSFSPSDCIVPASSARLDRSGQSPLMLVNVGKYDHFDMNLKIAAIRQRLLLDLP